jgi:hypothetical protein
VGGIGKVSPFHAMKFVGGVGVWLHSFVTTALSTGRLTPGKEPLGCWNKSWGGPQSRYACFCPYWGSYPKWFTP